MAEAAENEPSMEDILSSIRRIINEDEDEDAPAEEAEAEAEVAAEAPAEAAEEEPLDQSAIDDMDFGSVGDDDDMDVVAIDEEDDDDAVLELTDLVDDLEEGSEPMAVTDDLMIVDREDEEPAIDFSALEHEVTDGIMGTAATQATMGSFHQLESAIRISEEEGRTLEGVVRAMLRPMLKDWLDTHLPAIVNDKVQAEIDRVSAIGRR